MSKKKKDKVKLYFCGMNSEAVTGSMTLVEYDKHKLLIDCGLYQSNSLKRDFQINSRRFKGFKPKEIKYIFITHFHIDHVGLVCRLVKEGFKGKIIISKNSKNFMYELLKDSAYINMKDAEALSRKKGKIVKPIYTEYDVENTMQHIQEYGFNELYALDSMVSFKLIPAGHIIKSAQIGLYIKPSNHTYNLGFTGDIGNILFDKPFCEEFQPIENANIIIGECTYSSPLRSVTKKQRNKDIEKIKTIVQQVCIEQQGRLLIPSFSLDRSQMMLKFLYDLFGSNKNFKIPVILDSPLSVRLTRIYQKVLEGEDKKILNEIFDWKNLKMIEDVNESKACVQDNTPKIILSASGMCTAGRVKHYLKKILPNRKSHILFVGFSSENSLAAKIKNARKQKTINVDGKPYGNRCGVTVLNSFSSHMQYEQLLNYYSSINCEKIALVHSNFKDKLQFGKDLKERLEKQCKSTQVCVTNKGTKITL